MNEPLWKEKAEVGAIRRCGYRAHSKAERGVVAGAGWVVTSMNLLSGQHFQRYDHCVEGDRGPLPTSASPRFVQTLDGRRWLLKRIEDSGPEEVIGEAIWWLFGRDLGAPLPNAALLGVKETLGWMSEMVPDIQHWNSESRDQICNLSEVARMLVLDAVLGNEDRHCENLLLGFEPDESSVRVWAIDHGCCKVADRYHFAALGTRPPTPHRGSPDLPYAALRDPALEAASALTLWPKQLIVAHAMEAWAAVGREPPEAIVERLEERCRLATGISAGYLDLLGERP